MRDASDAGYKVNLAFVGIESASVSQWRVTHRVSLGLRFVPSDDIIRRCPRSMENLTIAMRLADRSILIDNTGEGFRLLLIRDQRRKPTVAKRLPQWMLKAVPEELR
jgi:predicted ABC-type ATPase